MTPAPNSKPAPHGTAKQLAALIQLCPELRAALARASSPSSAGTPEGK